MRIVAVDQHRHVARLGPERTYRYALRARMCAEDRMRVGVLQLAQTFELLRGNRFGSQFRQLAAGLRVRDSTHSAFNLMLALLIEANRAEQDARPTLARSPELQPRPVRVHAQFGVRPSFARASLAASPAVRRPSAPPRL